MLVLKGNLCIFLFSPALPTSLLCLDAQQCFNSFEGEKVPLWKTTAVFICSFSTLFALEHWSVRAQAEKKMQGDISWRFRKEWCLWEGNKKWSLLLSRCGPGAPGRWGCFAGMCLFRDSCASGRRCLVLSAACGKRWFVSLYWWIIFQYDSRRWPSDQLHKLLVMDWSDMQELLDHSVQELCPPSFLHPLLRHIFHRLLKCLAFPKSHLCSNICFDHRKWQIIPHGYLSWMILPEFTLWS